MVIWNPKCALSVSFWLSMLVDVWIYDWDFMFWELKISWYLLWISNLCQCSVIRVLLGFIGPILWVMRKASTRVLYLSSFSLFTQPSSFTVYLHIIEVLKMLGSLVWWSSSCCFRLIWFVLPGREKRVRKMVYSVSFASLLSRAIPVYCIFLYGSSNPTDHEGGRFCAQWDKNSCPSRYNFSVPLICPTARLVWISGFPKLKIQENSKDNLFFFFNWMLNLNVPIFDSDSD